MTTKFLKIYLSLIMPSMAFSAARITSDLNLKPVFIYKKNNSEILDILLNTNTYEKDNREILDILLNNEETNTHEKNIFFDKKNLKMDKFISRAIKIISDAEQAQIRDKQRVNKAFIDSIKQNNISKVWENIRNGSDINYIDIETTGTPSTALSIAITLGHIEIMALLIQCGASVNAPNLAYTTRLKVATKANQEKIAQILIAFGCDINETDYFGDTALIDAVSLRRKNITQLLLTHGADVNIENENKFSALYFAICNEDIDIAALLLYRGANITQELRELVQRKNNPELTKLFIKEVYRRVAATAYRNEIITKSTNLPVDLVNIISQYEPKTITDKDFTASEAIKLNEKIQERLAAAQMPKEIIAIISSYLPAQLSNYKESVEPKIKDIL